MPQLPKQYDPKISEAHWQKRWEEMGVYHFRDDKPKAETFVIDTPPPTVSGVLHMGHIFSYTQADFIARYKRMRGFDVFYPMGFDDNGLPTERLVEKTKNVRGSAMKREEFVALCREVVKDAEDEFRKLFTGVALSVDWNQLYQTVSDRVTALSQASFLDLISKNECYRDFRPGYWDWVDQTAIATAEIENKEMQGVMVELRFSVIPALSGDLKLQSKSPEIPAQGGDDIVIATTRPELLGACVAVMYHPEDANAAKYKNAYAITPLFGVKVPMIADEAVDKEFGTGLVMCCTFGDDTDKEWARRYELPWRPILGADGKIYFYVLPTTDNKIDSIHFTSGKIGSFEKHGDFSLPICKKNCVDLNGALAILEQIKGLKPKQAREKSIELLQVAGALVSKKDITHTVKCAERSGTPIEIIPTSQWFVKLTDKKEALKKKGAEVNWNPPHMKIRLDQWIDGLKEDWCISRQRFFGVPFPVWYSKRAGEEGKVIYADVAQLPIDPTTTPPAGYSMDEVTPDIDVMDTWATSSISPQISAGAIKMDPRVKPEDDRFSKLFPADLRPQAHEIIRTWAFYTIAKAYLHTRHSHESGNPANKELDSRVRGNDGLVPWTNIMISGWCLAADKTKMSKSKGNVVTPVALIEDKGADAVRYWASTSRLATDTAFSEDLLKIGKKLVGKIWNAASLVAQVSTSSPLEGGGQEGGAIRSALTSSAPSLTLPLKGEGIDRWILSRLHVAITKATEAFEQFEYCDARVAIEDFFWNDFCDNYLELVKARAYNEGEGQASALVSLHTCLEAVLRLFAPFVPHVTEEIYSHLFAGNGSVHARGQWPVAADYAYDAEAEKAGIAAVEILEIIRKAKSEAAVSIKAPVARVMIFATEKANVSFAQLHGVMEDLKAAGSVHEMIESSNAELPYTTRDGAYKVAVELAKVEEIKRNSEHSPDEKIEGKILSAPGNPDLSKHVVKLQVQSLPTSLERQK